MLVRSLFVVSALSTLLPCLHTQPPQGGPNLDQILDDIRILTSQQLNPSTPPPTSPQPTPAKQTSVKLKLASSSSSSQKSFQLPSKYDPNRIPRTRRSRPLVVSVNMTVLHVSLDRNENLVELDLELREHWRDKRLRLRKANKKDSESDDDDELEAEEDDKNTIVESHLLEPEWAARIWHPVSRLQNNAEVIVPFLVKRKPTASKDNADEMVRQKTIEQEYFIENILVLRNESSAFVYMTMRVRLALPMYECRRDDTALFPFDRIRCSFHIANVVYNHKLLEYKWHTIKWQHNGHQRGEFYLRSLDRNIENRLLVDLDKDNQEHSTMKVEILLKRQIGDYILNVYLLQIFLLALCVSTFWISITNILIRLALPIIVLIIIKFQTIQSLKEDRHIVSALSIWTFGLSVLVLICLLLHILSYYSMQHKWNDKILTRLVAMDKAPTTSTQDDSSPDVNIEMQASGTNGEQLKKRLHQRWHKMQRGTLLWLNSILLRHSKQDGYDNINLVDILSRLFLPVLYTLFVLVYFLRYAL